jgi:hypothetical protein
LDKGKIKYLTENQSQLRRSDEANEEEDDIIESAPIPPSHRVYKQGRPMCHWDMGVLDNGTDDSYDTATSLAPQGVLIWGQLMSGTNSSIHQFTGDW